MNKGLTALAFGTFALGIAEFTMMGILGNLSESLNISITRTGHLISAYAIGVCVGAPALLVLRKYSLKRILLILSAIILAGNLFAALAPDFWSLFAARFISGIPHGAYFGVGAIVARKLASPGKEVMAVSIMIAGMTVATLLGVPLGTFLSNMASWRLAFLLVALSGLLTLIAIRRWVPQVGTLPDTGFRGQFRFLKTLPPWLIFGGVLFGQIGIYCWYSYIDPLLTSVTGFPTDALSWLMVLAGAGMFAGNLIAGQLSDRYKPSIVAALVQASGMVILAAVFLLAGSRVAMTMLLFLGTASLFGSGSPLQSSIVVYSRGGEMLGAAGIQIAYNAGNALAAWIGGAVIASTSDYRDPALVGIPIVLAGCVLLFILYARYERGVAQIGQSR